VLNVLSPILMSGLLPPTRKSHRPHSRIHPLLHLSEISGARIFLDLLKAPVSQTAESIPSYFRVLHIHEDSQAVSLVPATPGWIVMLKSHFNWRRFSRREFAQFLCICFSGRK